LAGKDWGDRWLHSWLSSVLPVRSAVIPRENNYLLNPEHPEFSGIHVVDVPPSHFDPRLF
jgi:RES domain-containing protein